MRLSWLGDTLRSAGQEVVELGGCYGRGRALSEIRGVVWHHTATGPKVSDEAAARLLRDGRSDLPGPLSQLGLDRSGRWWVIADGVCNHNGYGTWGNQSIGIEAYNDGRGEPWPTAQLYAYVAGTAAILRRIGKGASHVLGHRETDPDRKIDPTGIDMNWARAQIRAAMSGSPTTPKEDDLMVKIWRIGTKLYGALYVNAGKTPVQAWHLVTKAQADHLVRSGAPVELQGVEVLELVEVIG